MFVMILMFMRIICLPPDFRNFSIWTQSSSMTTKWHFQKQSYLGLIWQNFVIYSYKLIKEVDSQIKFQDTGESRISYMSLYRKNPLREKCYLCHKFQNMCFLPVLLLMLQVILHQNHYISDKYITLGPRTINFDSSWRETVTQSYVKDEN